MNSHEHARLFTSIIAAASSLSIEWFSSALSALAALVAILAGLPMAIRTVRGWFKPSPPPTP